MKAWWWKRDVQSADETADPSLPVIRLERVSKIFKGDGDEETHALADITVDIGRGEYVSVSAPSGCGKSTFLAILALLNTPSAGRYWLNGRATDRLSLEAGGEFAVNNLDSATRLTANGAVIVLPAANVQVQEDRGEVFAKSAWRPSDTLSLDASLRYEHSKVVSAGDVVLGKTLQFIKPRLALTWAPTASRQLRLRVEREVGQLNFNDFVASANIGSASGVVTGNPDLNPEKA